MRLSEYGWPEVWEHAGHVYARQFDAPILRHGTWSVPYGIAQCPVHTDRHGLYPMVCWPADDDVQPTAAARIDAVDALFQQVAAILRRVYVNHADYVGP